MKVFFDTNVLVAAFATRGLCADLFAHVLLEHELVVGEVVLDELREKLRTKLKLPKKTVDEIEALLRESVVVKKPAKHLGLKNQRPGRRVGGGVGGGRGGRRPRHRRCRGPQGRQAGTSANPPPEGTLGSLARPRTRTMTGRLRDVTQTLELPHPQHDAVPTGAVLVHQPSLTLAKESVSYGWQATRRLSTIARSAKVDQQARPSGEVQMASHFSPSHRVLFCAKVVHRSATCPP